MSPAPLRRRRSTFNPFLAVMLGVFGVLGILLTLHFTNQLNIPMLDAALGREVRAEGPVVDRVAVLVTARALQPGQAVHSADVWNTTTNNLNVKMIRRESVNPDWVLRWGDIETRVMAHAKLPGKAFKASDFLPEGTRPGVASLVPAGMRMVQVPHGRVTGLDTLRYEDRFDLIAHIEVGEGDIKGTRDALEGLSQEKVIELERLSRKSYTRPVSLNAMCLPAAPKSKKLGKSPISIAVAEADVDALLKALKGKDDLSCVVYSGNDIEWAGYRRTTVDTPLIEMGQILEGTREVRIRSGGTQSTVRVDRYQAPDADTYEQRTADGR